MIFLSTLGKKTRKRSVCPQVFLAAFSLMSLCAQSFDSGSLDRSVSPCQDFYRFACGTWMAKNPIPPDRARWGRFDELIEHNNAILRDILEKDKGQLGDFY